MSFVDSICIKFLAPSLVLYGKGNQLVLKNGKNKSCLELKTYDKIHKISFLKETNDIYRIACSAGREILITTVCDNKFNGGFITKFNDWISSIKYLSINGLIAIITCHNIAALLEISNDKLIIKDNLKCANNSTLYCSYIHGSSWDNLIFFSGTALGELIIWKKKQNHAKTVYQKSTHNGVIFSIFYDENYIITASDDRSIKVYSHNEDFSQLTQFKQLFGHTSRVFVGKVIKYQGDIKFLSAGEDSNLCIWTSNGDLQCKKNINASGGIWDLDYDENSVIVTSSSTGKLNKFELDKIFFETHIQEEELSIDPAKLLYLQNGTLCVLDSKMQLHFKVPKSNSWQKVIQAENVHKIVGMDVYENRLFLAAKNSILIFDYSTSSKELCFTSELNIDEKFKELAQKSIYFRAIHVLSNNEVFLSDVHGSCIIIDIEREIVKNLLQIPKSSEPWTTSVARIDNYWIIADRVGSLFLYQNIEKNQNTFENPIQKLPRLHGQTGVTTIKILADDFIRTTGNDGTIKTLKLNRTTSQLEFYQLERTPVHFIEKIKEYNGTSYVHGFNDNYFVMYKNREIMFEHKCGGRHRHWDLSLIDENKVQFAYIYKKQVHCVEFYLYDFVFDPNDNAMWHIKQCNVLKVINELGILISGGEDTMLKLTKIEIQDEIVSYKKLADINSHISSIKAIVTWKDEKSNELNIFSLGGRAQIILTRLINMKYVKEEINFMLTNSLLYGNSKESTFDPETRFTCAHFDVIKRNLFVGCSDGYLRIFKLEQTENSSSLKPLAESFYGRCILNITTIQDFVATMSTEGIISFWYFSENLEDQPQNSLKIIHKLQHNQNGINCFDVFKISSNNYRIATSGDDCGIFVTDLEVVDDLTIKCNRTIKSYNIHIGQVTGMEFIAYDELLTASVDQTVCKIKIATDELEIRDRRFTCISDVKGFAAFNKRYLFIHGAGLEAIKYF